MHPDPSAGLAPALARVAGVTTDALNLSPALSIVADAAAVLSPQADGAAAGWIELGRAPQLAATASVVDELERVQHTLHEGPVIDAVRSGVSCVGGDGSWRRFGPRAGRAGLHSALALAFPVGADTAWISLYSKAADAFDDDTAGLLRQFAIVAAVQLGNAQRLVQATRVAEQARRELTEGAIIERAVGILMSRRGLEPAEAMSRLRGLSQHGNVRLGVAAGRLVEEAVNRARARPETPA